MENASRRFVLNMLAYAAQRELSPQQLCHAAGINLQTLQQQSDLALSPKQLNDLWLNAIHLSGDKHFGLHFGEAMQIAALGIVGDIIKSSSTVGEAITLAANLTHLVTDLFQLTITQTDTHFTIQFVPLINNEDPPVAFKQTMDLFMVFVIHELDGLLLTRIKPVSVKLPFMPDDAQEYERVLRCRPSVKRGEYSLTFDNKHWKEPILTSNYELQQLLLSKVITVQQQAPARDPGFQDKIFGYMLANSYLGFVSLEQIAANFNVSPRWVQRKLKDEGITFQEIADKVRKSLALHYLESGKYPVKEISYILGYNELSAFTRAFKRWTGTTPVSYQKNSVN